MKFIISCFAIVFIMFFGFIFFTGQIVEAQAPLIVENLPISSSLNIKIINGEILLPLSIIKDHIDPTVYYEENEGKIIFTTKDKVIRFANEKLTALVNQKEVRLNIPTQMIDKQAYIPIYFLQEFLNIKINHIKSNGKVLIDFNKAEYPIATTIKKNLNIKAQAKWISKSAEKSLPINTELRVYSQGPKYIEVRTPNGSVGFIDKKNVKLSTKKTDYVEPAIKKAWKPAKGKINYTWEYVHKTTPEVATLKAVNELDVVSPTWFTLADADGNIVNRADKRYSDWAHKNGYQVWAMVTNNFDKDLTTVVLRNSTLRENFIRQLLIYAKLYDLDGINVDFESVYSKDRDFLTQLIRELAPLCKEQGLVLSMDVPKPSTYELYGKSFDYAALSDTVDYMMLMAYDQHWGSSPVAGSVAQYVWVEEGIVDILSKGVDKNKLLLGVPLYTRLWKEELIDGVVKVSSKALYMSDVDKIIAEHKLEKVWDEPSAQYYVEYTEAECTYKIWIEDEKSIEAKLSLIKKHDLAGIATWRRGFEKKSIWEVIKNNL